MTKDACPVPDCALHAVPSINALAALYDLYADPEFWDDLAQGLTHCEAFGLSIPRIEEDAREAAANLRRMAVAS